MRTNRAGGGGAGSGEEFSASRFLEVCSVFVSLVGTSYVFSVHQDWFWAKQELAL